MCVALLGMLLLSAGETPAQARPVLPSSVESSVAATAERERRALFAAVADAVVFVRCGESWLGSAFFVDPSGLMVTSRHVVECKGQDVRVILRNGEKQKADVVAQDSVYDLALLQVHLETPVQVLALADSDAVVVGDYVAAVGHPVGGVWTFNDGFVSNRYPDCHDQYAGILQAQVPLLPGSSGGPLLNRFGQVVGVVTAKTKAGDSMIFCIQSNLVRRLVNEHADRENGQLAVNGSLPGAELRVDGAAAGGVPALLTLSPGLHSVEVRAGGKRLVKEVTLEKGKVTQLFVKPGELR